MCRPQASTWAQEWMINEMVKEKYACKMGGGEILGNNKC